MRAAGGGRQPPAQGRHSGFTDGLSRGGRLQLVLVATGVAKQGAPQAPLTGPLVSRSIRTPAERNPCEPEEKERKKGGLIETMVIMEPSVSKSNEERVYMRGQLNCSLHSHRLLSRRLSEKKTLWWEKEGVE